MLLQTVTQFPRSFQLSDMFWKAALPSIQLLWVEVIVDIDMWIVKFEGIECKCSLNEESDPIIIEYLC